MNPSLCIRVLKERIQRLRLPVVLTRACSLQVQSSSSAMTWFMRPTSQMSDHMLAYDSSTLAIVSQDRRKADLAYSSIPKSCILVLRSEAIREDRQCLSAALQDQRN